MRRMIAITMALAVAAPAIAANRPAQSFVATAGQPVTIMVAGRPLRFLVAANGMEYPVLNPDVATSLGLDKGFLRASSRVGPVEIGGGTTVLPFVPPSTKPGKRRIIWFDRPIAPGADGEIGPAALSEPVVTINLHAPHPGERRIVLPMVDRYGGLGTVVRIGATELFATWDVARPDTLASAAAGQLIASAFSGRLTGAASPVVIRMGVARPVRKMLLDRPLAIGPASLSQLTVRVADYGDVNGVADADAQLDESEILVTAKSKQKPIYRLTIGRDGLTGCSSISFDKPAKQVILSCS